MILCYKPKDVLKGCDTSDLTALSGGLLVNIKALVFTKDPVKKFTLITMGIIDPLTGVFPIVGSDYYPIRAEWEKNSFKPNYEVISSDLKKDSYAHVAGPLIINNSESNEGKETIMALSTEKYVFIFDAAGTALAVDAFHVLGLKNGLQFVVEPTSDEVGGRVTGSLRSLSGGSETNPNGYNFVLAGGILPTRTLFNNRLNTVLI